MPSPSSGRCASRWPASRSSGSWASSTARPTTSSPAWRRRAPSYDDVLREAQELGLAERDPTADVEGHDAAAKAAILAALAFGSDVVDADVHREGISGDQRGRRRLRQPARLRGQAPGHRRADRRRARGVGAGAPGHGAQDAPAGRGARRLQRRVRRGRGERRAHALRPRRRRAARRPAPCSATSSTPRATCWPARRRRRPKRTSTTVRSQNDLRSAFYLSMDVADRPGVLAAVAKIFGDHDVSIRAMEQVGLAEEARLIFLTHVAREGDLLATIDELRRHQAVDRVSGVLRVIGERDDDGGGERRRDGRLARRHRGVPRLPPGHRADPGRHPARGRHAAGAGAPAVRARRRARCGSRSRGPTRPGASRTAA